MKVGRFQVMATLQAARAKELGLSIIVAKSWGLNRAIFYAAAKRGFKEKRVPRRSLEEVDKKPIRKTRDAYFLGDEMAYVSKKGHRSYFTIGGELQTTNDFKRQIESRFGEHLPPSVEGINRDRAAISKRSPTVANRFLRRGLQTKER